MILLSAAFVLVFLGAVSVIYTTTRLGIPPMPSSAALRATVLDMVREAGPAERIVDLGAGWGGLARSAALLFPQRRVEALEISWVPYLFGKAVSGIIGPGNLQVRRGDLSREVFDGDTIYICYLSPPAMSSLAETLATASTPRCRIVSAAFALPGWAPAERWVAGDLMRSPVYLYER
jgi:hypothetical protein